MIEVFQYLDDERFEKTDLAPYPKNVNKKARSRMSIAIDEGLTVKVHCVARTLQGGKIVVRDYNTDSHDPAPSLPSLRYRLKTNNLVDSLNHRLSERIGTTKDSGVVDTSKSFSGMIASSSRPSTLHMYSTADVDDSFVERMSSEFSLIDPEQAREQLEVARASALSGLIESGPGYYKRIARLAAVDYSLLGVYALLDSNSLV